MTITEYIITASLMSGLQIFLTIILPIFMTLAGTLLLIDKARAIIYRGAIDYLEFIARRNALNDDRSKRELAIAEAGMELRARRIELQSKRLELLDDFST